MLDPRGQEVRASRYELVLTKEPVVDIELYASPAMRVLWAVGLGMVDHGGRGAEGGSLQSMRQVNYSLLVAWDGVYIFVCTVYSQTGRLTTGRYVTGDYV